MCKLCAPVRLRAIADVAGTRIHAGDAITIWSEEPTTLYVVHSELMTVNALYDLVRQRQVELADCPTSRRECVLLDVLARLRPPRGR